MKVYYNRLVGKWRDLASITDNIYNDNKEVGENLSRAPVSKTKYVEN